MRLALDATYALDPHPSGVARYSDRLIRELSRVPELRLTLCARWPRVLRLGRYFDGLPFRSCWLQEPLNWRLPGQVDLFHGLNQRLPHYRFPHQVVTVHDVFALSEEDYSTPAFRARFSASIRDAVTRAGRVICVSAYTRDKLCRLLGLRKESCAVVHHGVEQALRPPSVDARQRARRLAGEGPFFLSVGAIQVRKNTLTAVESIGSLLPRTSARLVVVGSAGHGAQKVLDFIHGRGLRDRIRLLGYTDEPTLDALYAEATALLFPSLEEGFGLPVLEAMARGLPVIASNTSSLPEIAGDAAVLVDPRDVEGMTQAARRMVEDESWRAQWCELGRARASQFTWQRAAQSTLDVYRSLLTG